jgi:hypothetical protein
MRVLILLICATLATSSFANSEIEILKKNDKAPYQGFLIPQDMYVKYIANEELNEKLMIELAEMRISNEQDKPMPLFILLLLPTSGALLACMFLADTCKVR